MKKSSQQATRFGRLVRPCVRDFAPYIPGKPIAEIQKRFGLRRVLKLASNENALGPSPRALAAIAREAASIYRYPVGNASQLTAALAKSLQVTPREVLVGSGSDELIEILAKTFLNPRDSIVVSRHAFIRYRMAGQLMNCQVCEVPMKDFTHDLAAMARSVRTNTKLVFIANPNNPTGTFVTRDALRAFLDRVPSHVIVCVDEAYFEYAADEPGYPDSVSLYRTGARNLICLRTFSKIHALAGLRIGYMVGDPSIIDPCDRVRPPFNTNSLAQAAACASLADRRQISRSNALVRVQKARLYQYFRDRGIETIPSVANFILFSSASFGQSGKALFEALLARGIIVREMSEYGLDNWVRVTVSTAPEMDAFMNALTALAHARLRR